MSLKRAINEAAKLSVQPETYTEKHVAARRIINWYFEHPNYQNAENWLKSAGFSVEVSKGNSENKTTIIRTMSKDKMFFSVSLTQDIEALGKSLPSIGFTRSDKVHVHHHGSMSGMGYTHIEPEHYAAENWDDLCNALRDFVEWHPKIKPVESVSRLSQFLQMLKH